MYSRIKLSARVILSGSYFKILPLLTLIIFSVCIFTVCNSVLGIFIDRNELFLAVSAVTFIAFVMIVSPARLHLETRHFMLARGMKNIKSGTGVSGFGKSLFFYPLIFCIKLFWFAVFEAVPISSAVILYFCLNNNPLSLKAFVVICIGTVFLAVVGLGFYSVFIQRYSKASFYLVCYDDFSPLDAIGESVRRTKDSLTDILIFKLGFLPWFLLCIGIVPSLFVIPYYKQSLILFFINKK